MKDKINIAYRRDQISKISSAIEEDAKKLGAGADDIQAMAASVYEKGKARVYPKWFRALYALLYEYRYSTVFILLFFFGTLFHAQEGFRTAPIMTAVFLALSISGIAVAYVSCYLEVE